MDEEENFFKKEGYDLVIGSPVNYEEITVEILINGEYICLVQKEEGINKVAVEFFGEPIKTKVYYDVLVAALRAAKEELLK